MIGQRISHYSILEKLGEGGMGEVYLAQDLDLNRSVALKILPAELADEAEGLARFRREAESLAALNHPNIVTIHSIERAGDIHFLTMELVEGCGLDELLPEGGLDLDQLLEIATAICDALSAAHAKGITHRDLKPSNLMLSSGGRLKVLDFGLAKLRRGDANQPSSVDAGSTVTREHAVIGTLPHMSPEQVEGRAVDSRSDLFALGSVLYELATGRRPFEGDSAPALMSAIVGRTPKPMRQQRGDLPAGLARVIDRCLQKDPADRYQDADSVRRAIEELRRTPNIWTSRLRVPALSALIGVLLAGGGFAAWSLGLFTPGPPEADVSVLVVVPFENGGAPEDAWFAAAMTHGVAERLSTMDRLLVRRPPENWREKTLEQIRAVMQVDYLLHAQVFLLGEGEERRVLVTPQLTHAEDGALWPLSRCDEAIPGNDDLLKVQHRIAEGVAKRLGGRAAIVETARSPTAPTENVEAYTLYLKGLYFFGKRDEESTNRAAECFQRATQLDPDFALAHAGTTLIPSMRSWYSMISAREGFEQTKAGIERLRVLDPELLDAWAFSNLFQYDLDFDNAHESFERALAISDRTGAMLPSIHQWYSYPLAWRGRHEEALEQMMRAYELDPVSPIITTWVGLTHYYAGRYEEAGHRMDEALELDPDFLPAHWHRTWVCGVTGRFDEGIFHAERARDLAPTNPLFITNLAWALAVANREDEARALLTQVLALEQTRYVSSYHLAAVHVALGEEDEAFRRLDQAIENINDWRGALNVDGRFSALHGDPRFGALVERMGL